MDNINIHYYDLTKLFWHPAPTNSTDYGEEGWAAYNENYFYIYTKGKWLRRQFSAFDPLEEF